MNFVVDRMDTVLRVRVVVADSPRTCLCLWEKMILELVLKCSGALKWHVKDIIVFVCMCVCVCVCVCMCVCVCVGV